LVAAESQFSNFKRKNPKFLPKNDFLGIVKVRISNAVIFKVVVEGWVPKQF